MTSIDPAYKHVEFDTHGMTDQCPRHEHDKEWYGVDGWSERVWVVFSDCMNCPHFTRSIGFTVICRYPGYLANKEKEEKQ